MLRWIDLLNISLEWKNERFITFKIFLVLILSTTFSANLFIFNSQVLDLVLNFLIEKSIFYFLLIYFCVNSISGLLQWVDGIYNQQQKQTLAKIIKVWIEIISKWWRKFASTTKNIRGTSPPCPTSPSPQRSPSSETRMPKSDASCFATGKNQGWNLGFTKLPRQIRKSFCNFMVLLRSSYS